MRVVCVLERYTGANILCFANDDLWLATMPRIASIYHLLTALPAEPSARGDDFLPRPRREIEILR